MNYSKYYQSAKLVSAFCSQFIKEQIKYKWGHFLLLLMLFDILYGGNQLTSTGVMPFPQAAHFGANIL